MSSEDPKVPVIERLLTLRGDWRWTFFPLWIGQVVSLVGSRVVQFALIWYLAEETGSAVTLSMAALIGLVPEIVLGPIAGAFVDRWDRQIVMILSDGFIALVSWFLAYLFWVDAVEVGVIYLVLFIRSVGGSLHLPAMQASTSLMVPERHLTRVNGLNQVMNGLLTIAGPPLGALLLALMPYFGVMLVDVASAIVAIGLLMVVDVPLPGKQADRGEQPSLKVELVEGLRYIVGWRGLLIMVGVAMITRLLLTPAYTLLPLLVSSYYEGTASQLGLMEGILGAGMLAGGTILSIWGGFRRRIYTTMVGFVILGVGLVILGAAPVNLFIVALAGVLVIGIAVPLVDGPMMAIMQARVRADMQGRVFTLMGSLVALTSPIGLVIAGPLSDLLGIKIWFWLAGVFCFFTGIFMFFIPSIVNIEKAGVPINEEATG